MVVIAPTLPAVAPTPCELRLESGRNIKYIAAKNANPRTRVGQEIALIRKSSHHEQHDDWEGVNSLCHTLDSIVEIEMETEFFDGKSVLEIGFTTGLPSVYAFENGAEEIAMHATNNTNLELYCKPTLARNNIPKNKTKVSYGSIDELRNFLCGKKYDIILAADLLNRPESDFDLVHDILNEALKYDGICLFSCLTHYPNVDGSLAAFLGLVKRRREFDFLERWTSPKTDIIQNKVYQLTRSLF